MHQHNGLQADSSSVDNDSTRSDGILFLAVAPDDAADLERAGYSSEAWSPDAQASLVRYNEATILVGRDGEAGDDDLRRVLYWCRQWTGGPIVAVTLKGLGTVHRDLSSWGSAEGNDLGRMLDGAVEKARKEIAASKAKCTTYSVVDGRLCRMVASKEAGSFPVPMANFNAWITGQVIRDDGSEQIRRLSIEGVLATGEALPAIEIAAGELPRGDWPLIQWGYKAVVFAGQGNKDHLRAAIQIVSDQAVSRTVFTHTGWRKLGGQWLYLHSGGAIGTVGTEDFAVETPDSLVNYILPEPPVGPERVAAIRASLGILDGLVSDRVAFPLMAIVYRSVLPDSAYSGHLSGRSGAGKTELAALAQQHFGAGMVAGKLPANWSSTANSLEFMAFSAKDAILVVDDFCPAGGQVDVSRLHKEADRLFRAQGNRSGRQRLRSDGSQRPTRPPRGTIVSTGEDVPRGHSLRARLLIIEVEPGDVDFVRLSACQADAAVGIYAGVMAAYVRWLAPRFEEAVREFKAEAVRLRGELTTADQHRRTPAMIGELIAGFELFVRFATEAGAITGDEAASLRERCRRSLLEAASAQEAHQRDADPCERYFYLLRSALASGRAHVAGLKGDTPIHSPQSWGWRAGDDRVWRPQGRCIGWVDGPDLYLDADAAYASANLLACEQGESLTTTRNVLQKRLHEDGRLASVDKKRQRLTIRKTVGDSRREVLHLRANDVSGVPKTVPNRPSAPSGEKPPINGTFPRDGFSGAGENRPAETSQVPGGEPANGPIGTFGTVAGAGESPGGTDANRGPRYEDIDWRVSDPWPF
jgi:hypothetical protein